MAAEKFAGKSNATTCRPGKLGIASTASGGDAQPSDAHKLQCAAAGGASSSPASEALDRLVLTLQMPLSCPLRTSWANIDTGAHKADSTARKPSQAASRAHTACVGREWGW